MWSRVKEICMTPGMKCLASEVKLQKVFLLYTVPLWAVQFLFNGPSSNSGHTF